MSEKPSAAERVYRHLKDELLSGRLDDGQMLSEGDLADRLTVSRTPVREALLRLEAEGWLRLYPKRGALVVPPGPGDAQDLVEARVLLETHAVAAAVAGGTHTAAAAAMRDAVARQREAIAAGDLDAYAAADADLHVGLVAAGGNALLTGFAATVRERQQRMAARLVRGATTTAGELADEHERLADLVAAGDVAGFERALTAHLGRAHL